MLLYSFIVFYCAIYLMSCLAKQLGSSLALYPWSNPILGKEKCMLFSWLWLFTEHIWKSVVIFLISFIQLCSLFSHLPFLIPVLAVMQGVSERTENSYAETTIWGNCSIFYYFEMESDCEDQSTQEKKLISTTLLQLLSVLDFLSTHSLGPQNIFRYYLNLLTCL